jgi:hypothetical protein
MVYEIIDDIVSLINSYFTCLRYIIHPTCWDHYDSCVFCPVNTLGGSVITRLNWCAGNNSSLQECVRSMEWTG